MLNDKIETVECSISSIAMDDLAGTHGSFPRNERDNFCTFAKRNRSLTNVCYREGDFLVTPHVLIAHENKARRFTLAGFRHESFLRSIVAMPSGSRGWSGPARVVHNSPRAGLFLSSAEIRLTSATRQVSGRSL